jgi:tripeptidyl-peptidase II
MCHTHTHNHETPPQHCKVEAELQREAAAFKAAKGSKPPATTEEAEEAADMEARVAQLAEAAKAYDDAGCLYDCVVWHDGERWWAALDVQEDGDLRAFEPMTDYRVRRDWRTFNSRLDNLNFAVNIYEEGAVLSIVVDAGSHGTHVAGITAAYHKEQPALNGLAPGVQLVSLKIGDSRLGSMETGVSVVRALCEVVRLKCNMINMSYGEAVAVNETGRVMKLIEEVRVGVCLCLLYVCEREDGGVTTFRPRERCQQRLPTILAPPSSHTHSYTQRWCTSTASSTSVPPATTGQRSPRSGRPRDLAPPPSPPAPTSPRP